MQLSSPRLWIGVLSAGAVLFLAIGDVFRTSPGPLATVHARAVTGLRSCAQCHGGWFGSMAESCLECHGEIAGQVAKGHGLHGSLGSEKAMQCALCHSDHHGGDFAMVSGQSFLHAGVEDRALFRHDTIGFAMAGQHLELDCKECHVHADTKTLPEGEKRFLGLRRDCQSCHEDPHEGRMVVACAQCHSQESFDERASADHARALPLLGGHADVQCATCHEDDGGWSLEAVGHGIAPPARTCASCHESPHKEEFVAGVARITGSRDGASCGACHRPEHTSFQAEDLTVTPQHHRASGFPLDAPHDRAACADCHAPTMIAFDKRYPGRGADDCKACHDDPHGGQFDEGRYAGKQCTACHHRERFEPHAFTVAKHAEAALPLEGRHLEAACDACHVVPAKGRPRVFHGTPTRCDQCHDDAHSGFFLPHAAELRAAPHGTCASCHTPAAFTADDFDHVRWTGFAVRGAHAQVDCESCHARAEQPDDAGRTFGRVEEYRGCQSCHIDPHRGEFDKPGLPRAVEGRTDCARCHVETSFRAFPKGFDHGTWTKFPLEGRHEEIGCSECHAPRRKPDRFGRSWGRAKGTDCAVCHQDSHEGQFDVLGVTDCQRCHRSSVAFSDLVFRHDLDARFRLGTAHARVACDACHVPERKGDRRAFVRYRPLKRECADCHTAQGDPLRPRKDR